MITYFGFNKGTLYIETDKFEDINKVVIEMIDNLDINKEFYPVEEVSKDTLTKDAENMLEIMDKTVNRADIWQDRFIYWIAVAIYHLIVYIKRNGNSK